MAVVIIFILYNLYSKSRQSHNTISIAKMSCFIVSATDEVTPNDSYLSLTSLHSASASHRKMVLLSPPDKLVEAASTSAPPDDHFVLLHTAKLNQLVGTLACPQCSAAGIHVAETDVKGYAVQLCLICDTCGTDLSSVYSSPKLPTCDNPTRQPYMINHLAVLAAREGGINQTGLVRLTTLMNIKGGVHHKTFSSISDTLKQKMFGTASAAMVEAHDTVRRVYQEIHGPCDGPLHISVSYDGSWKTRGFNSLFGVGFVIEVVTGLVIDYVVRSKYCVECTLVGSKLDGEEKEQWLEIHEGHCDVNHTGSSGSMEVEAAKVMWARSMDLMGAQYTSILGDGDAAVMSALNTMKPYGADPIQKHECINHMSKRMYKGLEKVVKESAGKGKGQGLSGKGKLTVSRMKAWSQYYRNAIVKHAPDVDATRHAIWAILFHSLSTTDDPHHAHCDLDWCYYQQALAEGTDPDEKRKHAKHDSPLPRDASECLLPLFEQLSDPALLSWCMSFGTSNANESLHAVVWRRAHKAVFSSRTTVEIAVAMGVTQFNQGSEMLVSATQAVAPQAATSSQLLNLTVKQDLTRLRKADIAVKEETRSSRKRKALLKVQMHDKLCEEEGHLYDAGAW